EVWSTPKGVQILAEIMSEDHEQNDMVWQPASPTIGMRKMKRGILAYRLAYPDLIFTINHLSCCEDSQNVFVSWTARGTNLGPIREQPPTLKVSHFSGITRLLFNAEDRIQASFVFRQAPADEATYFLAATKSGPGAGAQPS
ncbi:hypothetical protein TSOC_005412, partial [Tetrabaena socialis]